jgi:hypothetical protein
MQAHCPAIGTEGGSMQSLRETIAVIGDDPGNAGSFAFEDALRDDSPIHHCSPGSHSGL